uniref:EamA domain-containing protein n=2 Tax=Calcidiscus leptoporus TaxID=127549 RepID=A0A7S0J347_9EUKA|mmetsp:Transcript_35451/g.82815  ORF Transcript_35451/g.82815 Transcript_35451/m.82815 type:complete len:227 (+) Transcript_35451:931-1611(+)
MLAMGGVCCLSGFAGVLTELLLKEAALPSSLWVRNLQMSLFSLPIATAAVPISDGAKLHEHGPWVGCNAWLAATVALGACGGVLTSVVLKYADTLLKSFAVGCSIALACLLSRVIFESPFANTSLCGIALVATSSTVYYFWGAFEASATSRQRAEALPSWVSVLTARHAMIPLPNAQTQPERTPLCTTLEHAAGNEAEVPRQGSNELEVPRQGTRLEKRDPSRESI